MSDEADFIVIRGTDSQFDGQWHDRASKWWYPAPGRGAAVTLEAADEFEFRDDGACAQVWRPVSERPQQ